MLPGSLHSALYVLYVLYAILSAGVFMSDDPAALPSGPHRQVGLSGLEEAVMKWSCQGPVIKSCLMYLIRFTLKQSTRSPECTGYMQVEKL